MRPRVSSRLFFGTGTVNKVYDEFIALSGVEAATKAEVKEAAAQQQNIFMRAIKVLGDVFVPIIPAIVASGLLLGIMSALNFMASNGFIALDTNNFIYKIADGICKGKITPAQMKSPLDYFQQPDDPKRTPQNDIVICGKNPSPTAMTGGGNRVEQGYYIDILAVIQAVSFEA